MRQIVRKQGLLQGMMVEVLQQVQEIKTLQQNNSTQRQAMTDERSSSIFDNKMDLPANSLAQLNELEAYLSHVENKKSVVIKIVLFC